MQQQNTGGLVPEWVGIIGAIAAAPALSEGAWRSWESKEAIAAMPATWGSIERGNQILTFHGP